MFHQLSTFTTICLLALVPTLLLAKVQRFRHWSVFTIGPAKNQEQTEAIQSFLEDYDDSDYVYILCDVINRDLPVEVAVSPYEQDHVISYLATTGLSYTQTTNNLQRILDEEMHENLVEAQKSKRKRRSLNRHQVEAPHYYMLYGEINDYLKRVVNASEGRAKLINIGKSYQNRSMYGIKLNEGNGKPKIWIDAGIHAREWIAPATALHIIHQIVFNESESIRSIADAYQWFILPMVNPDGYYWTWTENRLWRKNRSPNDPCPDRCKRGFGVDLNRNFDFNWGRYSQRNPCSFTYQGTQAFSEHESRNIRDFILANKQKMVIYFSLHCFMQLWVLPWVGVKRRAPDFPELVGFSGDNPCSLNFHGRAPFSEPESRNIRDFLFAEKEDMHIYFSLHAYLQYFVLPWVGEHYRAPDYPDLERVANLSAAAIYNVHGETYEVLNFPERHYLASGSSMDWAKATAGVKYAYTLELRPNKVKPHMAISFQLPPTEIKPTGEEILAGVLKTASLVKIEIDNNHL